MEKRTKTRFIIFQILMEVNKKNKNFEEIFDLETKKLNLKPIDKSFIFNVCLNTMRYNLHSKLILKKFVRKKLKTAQFVLLSSAITQIVYLNIKPYGVVNETVNTSKKIGLFPSFVNAILNNVVKEKKKLQKIKVSKKDLPLWFQNEYKATNNLDLNIFLNSYFQEPSLHIVFKKSNLIHKFKEKFEFSSKKSVFIKSSKKVNELSQYNEGNWWVQNYSSMIPLTLADNLNKKKILDICAAPGGKAFQVLSEGHNITLNDISKKRIRRLKENLLRLNFSTKVNNYNGLNFPQNKKFDIILLDAPCSAIGTIRSNPEIFFKSRAPDIKSLNMTQLELLKKCSMLLKKEGSIIYMVCSFFFSETLGIINKFLKNNKNYSILKYNLINKDIKINNFIYKNKYFLTMPTIYKNYKIDGFFSIQLIKND